MVAGLIGGQNGEGESIERVALRSLYAARATVEEQRYSLSSLRAASEEVDAQLATPTPLRGTVAPRVRAPINELPYVERAASNSIEGIICSFDWDCDYWIAVARCESSLRPSAVGLGAQYVGVFQVWLGHGYEAAWLLDPYNNTLAAWELSDGGTNTAPWPYCR